MSQTFCFLSPFVAWSTMLLFALWAIFLAMDNFHFLSESNSCSIHKFKIAKFLKKYKFMINLSGVFQWEGLQFANYNII